MIMATRFGPSPIEKYWNTQRDTLRDIRSQLGYESYPTQQFKPLPDRHPLLQNVPRKRPVPKPRRHSTTPPAQLPKMRGGTPPERSRHGSPNLRGSKYDVVPPVHPKRAFASPSVHKHDDNDSWGEEEESSEDEEDPMKTFRGYPYPMVMYPYPMMMAPQPAPHISPRKSKSKKDGKPKKKVHYRNTPVYLSSRENTKHEPRTSQLNSNRDPFDPRSNSVLERYQYPAPKNQPLQPNHPYYPSSFYYCEDFLDEVIPSLVQEVVEDASYHIVDGHLLRQIEKRDPLEDFLSGLLNDVIAGESTSIVKEVAKSIAEDHLEKAAAYDEIQDMTGDLIREVGPGIIEDAILENMIEDLIIEDLVEPEVTDQVQELAVETLTHYSDKVRARDIRELKKSSAEKAMESIILDYLMTNIVRHGELWTEGEHANKLLDEIMLSIVLTEFVGVEQKRHTTVDNKPARRYYEKVVTDVTLDVLLEEISQNLDEDMADLDEYEQGLENPDFNYEMPKELKKWFSGR